MKKVNRIFQKICKKNYQVEMRSLKMHDEDDFKSDIYEKLKYGYGEMSEINLTLAEFGLEEDMLDLSEYEAQLGCDMV